MKKYFWILMLTLAGCGDSADVQPVTPPDTPEVPEQHAMSFIPGAPAISRATSPLQYTYDIFRVWSYKTTATSTTETVMPGYQVKWLGEPDRWQYDGTTYTKHPELTNQFLKYWDESARVYNFLGIVQRHAADQTPVNLPDGVTIEQSPEGFVIKGLIGHSADAQDIVLSHQRRYVAYGAQTLKDVDMLVDRPNDIQPTTLFDNVPMVFHHMISRVEYWIYNTGSETANITNVEVNSNQPLVYSGNWSNGVWTETSENKNMLNKLYSPTALELESVTDPANPKAHAKLLNSYYELPQSLGDKITIAVAIEGSGVITKSFDMPDNIWLPDHNYVYYIRIESGESMTIPILIDLEVVDFAPGWVIDDEETNW